MKETVLITGAAGFIGSNIAEYLQKVGKYRLILIDDLSSGKLGNLSAMDYSEDIKFVRGSIMDRELLDILFREEGVDYVLHHAAIASVPASIDTPLRTMEINVNGTLNVFLAAQKSGVKRVVYASSSAYYGEKNTPPLTEDMPPDPLSPYASSKVMDEFMGRHFNDIYGLPTVGLRYFNVYGPKQSPDSQYAAVIPKFIERCRKDLAPVIFGDGKQTRDFVYVKDVAVVNHLLLNTGAADGKVLNIGTGEAIEINDVASLVIEMMGCKEKVDYRPERPGDIKHSFASIALARNLLGFNPSYNLRQGLKEVLENI